MQTLYLLLSQSLGFLDSLGFIHLYDCYISNSKSKLKKIPHVGGRASHQRIHKLLGLVLAQKKWIWSKFNVKLYLDFKWYCSRSLLVRFIYRLREKVHNEWTKNILKLSHHIHNVKYLVEDCINWTRSLNNVSLLASVNPSQSYVTDPA
jgi:hypothetical protein